MTRSKHKPSPADTEAALRAKAAARIFLTGVTAQGDERETVPAPSRDEYLKLRELAARKGWVSSSLIGPAASRDGWIKDAISKAKKGDQDAHFELWRIAYAHAACTEPLSPLLEYMIVDAPAFKPRRGRPARGDPEPVDGTIASAVAILVKLAGLSVYPPREPHAMSPPTACAIVAEVLWDVAGIRKTPGAIEKIYERHYSPASRRRLRKAGSEIK
jgi:hypothetical protein